MDDRNNNPSPSSSSSSIQSRRLRRHAVEEDAADTAACAGKSCQSCTAGAIADCLAVCCCPCAVVNLLALAFFKVPVAVARRCIRGRKKKSGRRRIMIEEKKRKCGGGDIVGISEKGRAISEIELQSPVIVSEDEVNDDFSAEFEAEGVWYELYEFGHMGFGRVSFTGISFHNKGN